VKLQSALNMTVSRCSKGWALLALSLGTRTVTAVQDPKNSFCRRYGHQSTVIDDKLYIDGGWVNFDTFKTDHKDTPSMSFSLFVPSPLRVVDTSLFESSIFFLLIIGMFKT
jgi:hypothetical protein